MVGVSLLGLLGSRASARCAGGLLSAYALCLLLLLLALCGLGVHAYARGASALSEELELHWGVVQAVVQEDIGVTASKDDFVAALNYHGLLLAIAGGLLGLGLLLLLAAACVLRRYISGPKYQTTPSEMATLLDEDESDVI